MPCYIEQLSDSDAVVVSKSDLKMGKRQSKIYVAKESFKPMDDELGGTTCGYITFEARIHLFRFIELYE